MKRVQNWIANSPSPASQWIVKTDPATLEPLCEIPRSTSRELEVAIVAARDAFPKWRETSPQNRSEILRAIARSIEARLDEFSKLESQDTGKPITLAQSVDIPRAIANFNFFAGEAEKFSPETFLTDKREETLVERNPLGIVACISPWNLPLYLLTWKIAPALAAGNCVIAKPSEITPQTASLLGEIAAGAGLPPGVLSILHGYGPEIGQAIITHPEIKAISFTGSTQTGRHIAEHAAKSLKKVTLEMGGKNAALIFKSAQLDLAVSETARSSFSNQGQICLCTSRILVEQSIYTQFRDQFVKAAKALLPEDPLSPSSRFGAISSQPQFEKILSYLETAKKEGARVLSGGEPVKLLGRCQKGYFIPPTVLEGLSSKSKINQEEIFGPVVTLNPFETESHAIETANDTRYGLTATVWTEDHAQAMRVARSLHTGLAWINCWMVRDLRAPFGGVKDSGFGKEGGMEAMRFFTEPQSITRNL